MNLLLDTHIWLWSKLEPDRLGPNLRVELDRSGNELWLSPVSIWEALVLIQKGRVSVQDPFTWVHRASELMREAPLTHQIVGAGLALPLLQADPADRFLAGTAKILNLTLVTADRRLLGLGGIMSLDNR